MKAGKSLLCGLPVFLCLKKINFIDIYQKSSLIMCFLAGLLLTEL